jgi:hypothetical protein
MAYTNPRGLAITDVGPTITMTMAYTLADYSAGGTYAGAASDLVTFSTTGNHYVKLAPDNQASRLGRVKSILKAASGTEVGYLTVEWLDVTRFVACDTDDLTTITLGDSLIKDGNTAVYNNFDAGATTGIIIAIAKSGTSGAGTVLGAVCAL